MPEIKNTFLQGKMNKDLDERLIPNGQYRDALNVEVSTSEGSDVGTVKNILGNKRIEDIIPQEFKCIGSIADEKNNKLYWFVTTYEKDAIIEYDAENEVISPVIVDLNAGNYKAVLKFSGNIITGINIIDNLLFWTDNRSDPKKINIDECKKGTPDFNTHTQLIFDHGSFHGLTLRNISNHGNNNFLETTPNKGRYFWFDAKQAVKMLGITAFTDFEYHNVRHYRGGKLLQNRSVVFFGTVDGNGTHGRYESNSAYDDFHVGDILYGDNITMDIAEQHITVIKPKPLKAPTVKINHAQTLNSPSNIPNLFETKLPRFSYRYKYVDGEFSAFAPFTEPVFNPKYTKNINDSSGANAFYNKDNAYDIKEAHNKAMINSIHSIELTDFITAQTPEDVVEIDILYKQENSSIIYSIETIKHGDPEWHDASNSEGYNLGYNKDHNSENYNALGGHTKGKYVVTTENIYAALPANQLLRPWDNVPRKALAQEVTGNRVVYGNYLQNYNLGTTKPEIKVSYSNRSNQIGSFETQGLPSIKSQRNYQLGVIYCDKYGRETPVFTSDNGAVSIPWQESNGTKNASKNLQLNASVATNFPDWVDSLKFFIKETSKEYYNLVMDRAWVSKATYELDNSEGHLWISFPSSDRNKVSENDYLILKKKVGSGEEQVSFENKFKILDIKNEAPDAIKYELANQGVITNTTDQLVHDILNSKPNRIDLVGNNNIYFDAGNWLTNAIKGVPFEEGDYSANTRMRIDNLYLSWRRLNSDGLGVSSKKYKVESGRMNGDGYMLKLSAKITQIDADIAHVNGLASTTNTQALLHPNLMFQVERKILKSGEDFSGKFFVKISKNQVTDLIETGYSADTLDNYITSAKQKTWYWQDDIGSSITVNDGNAGLINFNGYDNLVATTNNNSILDSTNNGVGAGTSNMTDYPLLWDNILGGGNYGRTFFIDAMYMTAAQSSASDYAKYCCVTWSGSGVTDGVETPEDSSFHYNPIRVWLTDWIDSENFVENTSEGFGKYHDAINSGLIDTSPLAPADDDFKLFTDSALGSDTSLTPTGWVGQHQNMTRAAFYGSYTANHVNGLEGIVTTNSDHTTGPRRWFSGITDNQTETGIGVDTKTYSDDGEEGRHFMHLSFFAPGKDLIDKSSFPATFELFGDDSVGNSLQGVWGGGQFTGDSNTTAFGSDGVLANKHRSISMEGNYDGSNNWLPETPGPGVGFGYDLDYQQEHERQWDPTYPIDPENKIRDFIGNLHGGSQFKFSTDPNDQVYTIKKVVVKKIYNHTSWRNPKNRYLDDTDQYEWLDTTANHKFWSVEEAAIEWLKTLDAAGVSNDSAYQGYLETKLEDFGKASNRRLCYIIELDKNPCDQTHNPLATGTGSVITADHTAGDFANIEFVEQVQSVLLSDLNKFPAIWETDPRKQEVDLDIYYEASNNIPVRINEKTNELFAPIGCKVEVLDGPITGTSRLISWDNTIATFEPGFARGDGIDEINYTGLSFKFTREDGGFTIAEAGGQQLEGQTAGYKTEFVFRDDVGDTLRAGLSWYNCFSFGNGIESNRIRDDFNEMFITNGVKASTTTQETYEEERRSHGLIYSGIYNSNSGINDLNQFIMAEKITKDLNPTYGSIQKLFQRRISLIAFCEDRVIQITSNKDAIYNADGNPQLISSSNVLGDANPFVGNFGISKNPESFASESYRAYFTDKSRGAVLRLSKDGLTPISQAGMKDWFRDNLPKHTSLIGTYDSYKENYNITLSDTLGENIIYDTYFETGEESTSVLGGLENRVVNAEINNGVSLQYPYEVDNVLTETVASNPTFGWGTVNQDLPGTATITNHAAIPVGYFQAEVLQNDPEGGYVPPTQAEWTAYSNAPGAPPEGWTSTISEQDAINQAAAAGFADAEVPFGFATYNTWDGTGFDSYPSGGGLPDDGWWYDPYFTDVGGDLFGSSATNYADAEVYSVIKRSISGTVVNESSPDWSSLPGYQSYSLDPSVEKKIRYHNMTGQFSQLSQISQAITRNDGTGDGAADAITFDRVAPANSYVEFHTIGNGAGLVNQDYNDEPNTTDAQHSAFFNGDELHIQFELTCFVTLDVPFASEPYYGYNYIIPKLELFDGDSPTPISADFLSANYYNQDDKVYNPYLYQQTRAKDLGSDFLDHDVFDSSNNTSYQDSSHYTSSLTFDYACIKNQFQTSSTVTFPDTSSSGSWSSGNPAQGNSSAQAGKITIICGASFKFRDDDPNNQVDYQNTSVNVTERKVIDDLRIRISNNKAATSSGYTHSTQGNPSNYPLRNQLWEINNVKIKKGFGVVAPHTAFVAEEVVTSSQTTSYDPGIPIHAVTAVPPDPVPAWTEVVHGGLTGWTKSGSTSYLEQHTNNVFGNHYPAISQTGDGQDPADIASSTALPPISGNISYVVPRDWGYQGVNGNPPTNGTPFLQTVTNPSGSVYPDIGVGPPGSPFPGAVENHDNWIYIRTSAGGEIHVNQDISTDPWVAATGSDDGWYLVDVEFDDNYNPNTGQGGGDGEIFVAGVASFGNYSQGEEINSEGIGLYRGGPGNASVQLIPTERTEYGNADGTGDGKTVLRGIFQFASDAPRNDSAGRDMFDLWVYDAPNKIRIEKVITKKLNVTTATGTAVDWIQENNSGLTGQTHSFSDRVLYWKDTKLHWDVPQAKTDGTHRWKQSLNSIIEPSQIAWRLNFTVSGNLDYDSSNDFYGSLNAFVTRDASGDDTLPANSDKMEGIYITNIDAPGEYEVKFNMDGDTAAAYNDGTPVWTVEKDGVDYNGVVTLTDIGSGNLDKNTYGEKIGFESNVNGGSDLRMSVSNILLTDEKVIFKGGSAGSWNFDGFIPSKNRWIYWDITNGRLTFENAPAIDPPGTGTYYINANQWIDKPIKEHEQYKIEFKTVIDSGDFRIYYFNGEGKGFVWNPPNTSNYSVETTYNQVFTIGEYSIEGNTIVKTSDDTVVDLGSNVLRDTFVIQLFDIANDTNGWIDEVTMTRVFNPSGEAPKTITFSEDVNGWTSFKSFKKPTGIPEEFKALESGVSLSKKYFTMMEGGLFQHYVPTLDGATGCTAEEADNYNTFYGYPYSSTIKAVLNNEPSVIKTFNTLNYEGSQAYVKRPLSVFEQNITDPVTGQPIHKLVNINNARAWQDGSDINGWNCTEIKTDMDAGSVIEFIKKEGKWFNYIKGKTMSLNNTIDASRFSVQGIGVAVSVVPA